MIRLGGRIGPFALFVLLIVGVVFIVIVLSYYFLRKKQQKRTSKKLQTYRNKGKIKNNEELSRDAENTKADLIVESTTVEDNSNGNQTLIKLENLTKYYGSHLAVDKVNIEVHDGEVIGLVGPNGAGKTTIILMISRILRPSGGKILVRNTHGKLQDINKSSRNLLKFGFLIDVPSFYKNMTAFNILKYCALLQNYPRENIDDRINELLKLFDLTDWKHEKVKTFSKGMNQKLGIAQAIIHDPKVIIMDEPQTGLDPLARIEIRRVIKELQNQGKTIFVASHMLAEISEVCHKVALINHGKVVAFDTIENLEKTLKTNELQCEILNPIPPQELKPIITKLIERLNPMLDNDLDSSIVKLPIIYNPKEMCFKIYYKGQEETQSEILKILINEFDTYFSVTSFSKPKKTSQLEQIYTELIGGEESSLELQNMRNSQI